MAYSLPEHTSEVPDHIICPVLKFFMKIQFNLVTRIGVVCHQTKEDSSNHLLDQSMTRVCPQLFLKYHFVTK